MRIVKKKEDPRPVHAEPRVVLEPGDTWECFQGDKDCIYFGAFIERAFDDMDVVGVAKTLIELFRVTKINRKIIIKSDSPVILRQICDIAYDVGFTRPNYPILDDHQETEIWKPFIGLNQALAKAASLRHLTDLRPIGGM